MGKVYTHFQTKNSAKTIVFGAAHTYMAYIREYPPADNCGPMWVKVDKVTPLFFIKTINKGSRVASQETRCSSD